ncbi:hypothetical protein GCM10009540_36570 [Streptomyces turgidiscabies]|nr:hypothetical protein T45_04636 [Streptomyces turgidiscabies]
MGLVHAETAELYNAAVSGRKPELPPQLEQYRDYARRRRQLANGDHKHPVGGERADRFWVDYLGDAPSTAVSSRVCRRSADGKPTTSVGRNLLPGFGRPFPGRIRRRWTVLRQPGRKAGGWVARRGTRGHGSGLSAQDDPLGISRLGWFPVADKEAQGAAACARRPSEGGVRVTVGGRSTKRLQRGTLSQGLIVGTALRILDEDGPDGLTFQRLGKELSASATAVYRYFASRDHIMVAVAEELDRISLEGYEPHESWTESLRDLAIRAWNTALDHPAAAALCMGRVTRGVHELRAVDALLEAFHRGGWRSRAAVLCYQAYSNFILAMASNNAWRLVSERFGAETNWVQEYHPADPDAYPYAEAAKEHLRTVDMTDVFRRQVDILLAALEAEAATLPRD